MALKILFSFFPLFVKYNHGIALLSALCKEKGIETDLYVLDEPDKFRGYLRNSDANCVGFSCVTEHDYLKSIPFMEVAHEEKATMLGGVYPRRVCNIQKTPVDLICHGEGETLPDFLLNGDNTLFENNMVYPDLNKLPLPDYELFKNIPFKRPQLPVMTNKKILPYYSSRGCPYQCSFCEMQYQPKGIRVRYNVENDISCLVDRYHPDIVFMGDALLPYYDYNWRQSWHNIFFPFAAYIRADITENNLSWLIEHGMIACAFGIESGNENHRNDVLDKQLFDTDIFRTVEMLNKNNVEYAPFYMTDTPGETFTLKAETYKMAHKIGGYPVFFKYEDLGVGD